MKQQEVHGIPPGRAAEQETIPLPAFMQEQVDHIAGQLSGQERDDFTEAVSRYGLSRIQAGEKAIGEMGNQIRESEVSTEGNFVKSHEAVEAWTRRKANALWRARDEAVNELLYTYVPEDDPKHAAVSPAEEIQKSADEFLVNRVAGLNEQAAAILDAKVDAVMPEKPSTLDEEGVGIIGMFDFDETAQARLDVLEGLIDNMKPRSVGRTILRKVSGRPVPEEWTTDEEISAAIRDFTAVVDQVKQNGVSDTVKEAVAEHISRYNLAYPSAKDYVRLTEQAVKEAAHLFDPALTKKDIIAHLETTTVAMLIDMGYVAPKPAETPAEEIPASENADEPIEFDPAVLVDIDQKIATMRAEGLEDKKIFRRLSREYHPDVSGLPREYFQYLESRFRQ